MSAQQGLLPRPASLAGRRLLSLELGRGLAAASVLLFHLGAATDRFMHAYPIDFAFRWGHAGVEYFFVLSGFVMLSAHHADLGRRDRVGPFLQRRALRILPMLWLVLLALGAARLAAPGLTSSRANLPDFVLDLLLIPHPGTLTLNPGWTLEREAFFYALFALAITTPRAGFAVLAAWQAAILAVFVHHLAQPQEFGFYTLFILDTHNLGFGFGMLAAFLFQRGWRSGGSLPIGLAGFAACAALEWWRGQDRVGAEVNTLGEQLGPLLYTGFAGLIVFGAACAERRGTLRLPGWVSLLGGASYTLYLVHEPLSLVMLRLVSGPALARGVPVLAVYAASAAAIVGLSISAHLWIERPLTRLVRGWTLSRRLA